MANVKITDLTAYATPLRTDVLPIVDVAADTTKKVTVESIIRSGSAFATAVAATSGTSINFTGIPSWARHIRVMFDQASTSGTNIWLIQLGTSAGVESTGYLAGVVSLSSFGVTRSVSTAGFINYSPSLSLSGTLALDLVTGATWVASGSLYNAGQSLHTCAGSKTLSGTLDRVRITTVGSTDTFDGGTINIAYQG